MVRTAVIKRFNSKTEFIGELLNHAKTDKRLVINVTTNNSIDEEIYGKLKDIANKLMQQERQGHTLSPTDLVHEAYMKISGKDFQGLEDNQYFFILARQMRRLLIDYGRRKSSVKHGSDMQKVIYTDALNIVNDTAINFEIISNAIDELAEINSRSAKIIELCYFTGVSQEKVKEILNISKATLARDIHFAKAFIGDYINQNKAI
ncbi:MAG: sigma-70 family RNA polymerase sigma factor [Xanthomonadales bacterium]|nr:sigma-70 family RNA polymerase sigma factor [Xanthomonadales bacterium]MCB1593375.1 sigma-70 family RNA polymerase sigma factor [Xanthomonadales bacterium]